MRADIGDLFNDLLKHLDCKNQLLKSLMIYEKSASNLIKHRNDAEDDILAIIEHQTALIEKINLEDYNISGIRDEIIRQYRFDFNKIFKNQYSTSETEIIDYKNKILSNSEILKEIIILKEANNLKMDINQKDLQIQISELERMDRIEIIVPKDLQSF